MVLYYFIRLYKRFKLFIDKKIRTCKEQFEPQIGLKLSTLRLKKDLDVLIKKSALKIRKLGWD